MAFSIVIKKKLGELLETQKEKGKAQLESKVASITLAIPVLLNCYKLYITLECISCNRYLRADKCYPYS